MKSRLLLALTVGLLATAAIGGVALANGGDWLQGPPPHGHVLLNGVEIGQDGVSYTKCVELAAGRTLRGSAHHDSVHTGAAGGSPFAQGALFDAGHGVVPLAPLTPWTGCDDLPNPIPLGD